MSKKRINKLSKAIIDAILLLGLIVCINSSSVFEKNKEQIKNGANPDDVFSLGTLHCIVAIIFVFIMLIHIWQHWNFIKILITKKLYLKNKITTLTTIVFVLVFLSFLPFLIRFTGTTLNFHSFIAHIFAIIIIVHFITKFKQWICFFKNR
ncbi:MAG: hypothetical protein KJ714_03165 [Euryarchaeota archaeon]|nr:hypothetical protein [Euryarchaeota archaeon]